MTSPSQIGATASCVWWGEPVRAEWDLARSLALSRSPKQRWRQFSVVIGALLAVLVTLSGMSTLAASYRGDLITAARAPQWPLPGEEPTALIFNSGIILEGLSQIPLVYVEPMAGHGGDPSALPPGLDNWPAPGSAVISPGIRRQGLTAESFGFEASSAGGGDAGDIGDEGLISRSEGFIYARSTAPLPRGQDSSAFEVAGFGGDNAVFVETEPDVQPLMSALGYTVWIVFLPALFLMFSAARAVSHLLDARASTLWRIGVARRRIRALVALETLVLATTGAIVGGVLWRVLVPGRTSLPLNDTVLVRGALQLPLWVVLGVALAAVGLAVGAAAGARLGRRQRREPGTVVVLLAGLLQLLGWLVMSLSTVIGKRWGSDGLVVVLAIGFTMTVMSFPLAVGAASRLLVRLPAPRSAAMWLGWQRVRRAPRLLSRPAAQAGLLIMVTASAFALVQGVPNLMLYSPWQHESRNVSLIAWQDGAGFVPPTSPPTGVVLAPVTQGGGVGLEACEDLASFVGLSGQECADGTRSEEVSRRLHAWGLTLGEGAQHANALWVSAPTTWSQADVLALVPGSPAPIVEQRVGPVPFSRTAADWLMTWWLLGSSVLLFTLLRSVGDHLARSVHEGLVLDRIGLSRREVDRVLLTSTLLPFMPALLLALVGTVLFALRGQGVGYTVLSLQVVAASFLLGSSVAILMVVIATRRRAG